ncbi:hypothetical protein [Paraglaciecola polaris]|uniref:Uncharacterized protein n=1 Tax=Paraglaciecola polaris LMG 21857 TaxID=1129793 RepID=K7A446_9ALTE|nr:hypothetical protein [Paraglaciecola polaris]GAC35648.1 hypothetical protein GPLA_4774 [Paraglaciecola polaris LMG 21857]
MTDEIETRGRKPKPVDADRFLELFDYYFNKKDTPIPSVEQDLFLFMKQFTPGATNYHDLELHKKKTIAKNHNASDEKIWDNYPDHVPSDIRRKGLSKEVFLEIRKSALRYGHRFNLFNNDDIKHANMLFHNIPKDDLRKLMQRLRKIKHKREPRNRKVGIDLDVRAHNMIVDFTETYGFKNNSYAIMVMSYMASPILDDSAENPFTQALDHVASFDHIKKSELFTADKNVEHIASKVANNLIYHSALHHKFYLDVSLSSDSAAEACEIIDDTILRQMRSSSRIAASDNSRRFAITGTINNKKIELHTTDHEKLSEELVLITLNHKFDTIEDPWLSTHSV